MYPILTKADGNSNYEAAAWRQNQKSSGCAGKERGRQKDLIAPARSNVDRIFLSVENFEHVHNF